MGKWGHTFKAFIIIIIIIIIKTPFYLLKINKRTNKNIFVISSKLVIKTIGSFLLIYLK